MKEKEYGLRIEQIRSKLFKIALLYTGNQTTALDIVDEAVYKGLKNLKQLKEPEFFDTWMTRIVINECHKEWKRMKRFYAMDEESLHVWNTVEQIEEGDLADQAALQDALDHLPEDLQKVLKLRYLMGYSQAETADLLAIPQGTLVTKQRRALVLMRELLSADDSRTERSFVKAKRRNFARKFVKTPLVLVLCFTLLFGSAVNLSPAVAAACDNIPILSQLKDLLTGRFTKSIDDAVSHDYIQKLDLEDKDNGYIMRLDSAIVDQKQIDLFYNVRPENAEVTKDSSCEIRDLSFTREGGRSVKAGIVYHYAPGNLNKTEPDRITLTFPDGDIPEELHMRASIFPEGGSEPLAEFQFDISPDASYMANAEEIEIGQEITVGKQRFTVSKLTILPSHMELAFSGDEKNTEWLKNIYYECIDTEGNVYQSGTDSIIAAEAMEQDKQTVSVFGDSAWFHEHSAMTIRIFSILTAEKVQQELRINTETGEILCDSSTFDDVSFVWEEEMLKVSLEYPMPIDVRRWRQNLEFACTGEEREKTISSSSVSFLEDKTEYELWIENVTKGDTVTIMTNPLKTYDYQSEPILIDVKK